MKIRKKNCGGGRGGVRSGGVGLGGQGGWEWRNEAFVKIQKKKKIFFGGGGRERRVWGFGGQGGCERRSKVFVRIQKKILRGWGQGLGWGRLGSKVRGRWVMWGMGDVNQE